MTNPTPSAEERAKTVETEMRLLWSENRVDEITAFFAEQIRQAEQAAIDETRNEIKAGLPSAREILAHIQNILAIGDNPDVEALIRDCLADFRLGVAQAARADERRKTLEEAAQIANKAKPVGQHAKHIVHQTAERIENEIRALTNESGEPGEAA